MLVVVAAAVVVAVVLVRHRSRPGMSTDGAAVSRLTLHSRTLGRDVDELLVVPRRHGRTLLVVLGGSDGGSSSWVAQPFYDELQALGTRAPSVLFLDGNARSPVLREAIPPGLARTRARRVALGGISTGGSAALELGLGPGFCAVGAHSPAAPGSLLAAARRRALYGSRVWIDVGADDPRRAADARLARLLERQDELVEFHVWPGGHDEAYWRAHLARFLRFYADACG